MGTHKASLPKGQVSRNGLADSLPREMAVYNPRTGEHDQFIIPDGAELTPLSRWMYALLARVLRYVDWWVENGSPSGAYMRSECDRIKRERAAHAEMLKRRYPEDYNRAIQELEARYGVRLD